VVAGLPTLTKTTSTAPSAITPRPSNSGPTTPWPTTTEDLPIC
jgi:hypothetical protein